MSRPGFKGKPQRLKAAILAQLKSARVKLEPFPVDFFGMRFLLGMELEPA
jgi:hypothetical protein